MSIIIKKIKILNPSTKKKGLPQKKLEKFLKKWQKNLMLNDWNIDIKIVDFQRKDYRQSGDFKASLKSKKASILLSIDPFTKNQPTLEKQEEQTILHELIHIFLWEFDSSNEKTILKNCKKFTGDHDLYLKKLEKVVDKLTLALFFLKKEG